MYIIPCPKCGRQPKIEECNTNKKYKNGIRQRLCGCPKMCSVIPCSDNINRGWFVFEGESDDNKIYREWNQKIIIYKKYENKKMEKLNERRM